MKIAYLIDRPSLGGGCEYVRQLTQGLPLSFECRAFYSSRGECTARRVNAWRPDIIHVNHLRALLQLFRSPWRRPNAPVVFTVHGIHLRKYDFLPRTLRNRLLRLVRLALERHLYKKCAALIALTESDREEIHRLYGRDLTVVCIPNGIASVPPPHPLSDSKEDFAFICLGRFDFPKGQDVLLRAIAQQSDALRAKNRRTLFIGGGGTLDAMRSFADKLGVADLVKFASEIPNASRFLSRGRILIAPSRWEGLPFLLLEAGLQKKPVIATDCPGNRDIITNNTSGLLFPTEDINALATLLIQDFSTSDLARFGLSLESRVRSDFSLAHMLAATQALYSSLSKSQ